MPRSVFGLPLEVVIFSAAGFCGLVLSLMPGLGNLGLRAILFVAAVFCISKVHRLMSAGSLIIIIKPLSEEQGLAKQEHILKHSS